MFNDQHLSLLQIRDPHLVDNPVGGNDDTLARAPADFERVPQQPNEVLKLFPDRLIKVSSFIDLN